MHATDETRAVDGVCPSCETAGATSQPCPAPSCRRRGYHFIPAEYIDAEARRPDPLVGQVWGDYLLLARLGSGAVGAVYLAVQPVVGLRVAVKVLRTQAPHNAALASRFSAEAAALARLAHPNIVRLIGAGFHDQHPFIAMEYIGGGRTLGDAMAAGLPTGAARRILLQLVDALESAHRVDVVHRDVKPANIMLQSTGREPYFVRLVDFGLVKFTDDGASTVLAAGTPIYMAPEQALREEIGPWSDWYALGVLAIELLTGHRPFTGIAGHVLLQRKLLGEADPFESMPGAPTPALRRLADRLLAPDPQDRAHAAGEVTRIIQEASDAESMARPPSEAPPAPGEHTLDPLASTHAADVLQLPATEVGRPRRWALALVGVGGVAAIGLGWHAMSDDPREPAVIVAAGVVVPDAQPGADAGQAPAAVDDAGVSADRGRDAEPDGSAGVDASAVEPPSAPRTRRRKVTERRPVIARPPEPGRLPDAARPEPRIEIEEM